MRKSPPRLLPNGKELKIPWREKNPSKAMALMAKEKLRRLNGKMRNMETKKDREIFAAYKLERGL